MAVALPWYDNEDTKERRQTGTFSWGITFRRVYTVGGEDAESLPTRGDVMNGETGLTAPRVVNWVFGKKTSGGVQINVDWAQVVAYTDTAGTVASSTTLLELRGSRVPRSDGKYKYATRIYAATTEGQADSIPTLYTDSAAATDANDNLARRKVTVTPNNNMIPGIWILTAYYHGFKAHEILAMKDYDANRLQGPRGTRVFVEMAAGAVSKCASLTNSYFPGTTPQMPCYSALAQYEPFGIEDIALIVARYGLPVSKYQRKVGHARLSARVMSRTSRKLLKDLDNKIIEGWDSGEMWQIVPDPATGRVGSNMADDTVVFLKVETAVKDNSGLIADAMAIKNHVNSDTFSLVGYGNVGKEQFRSVGTEIVTTLDSKMTALNYYFEIEPAGWNSILHSQKGIYVTADEPVYTEESPGYFVDTDDTKPVRKFIPGVDADFAATKPETRRIHPTAIFSRHLRGLTKWTL